jgi:hypothetical protein
MHAQALVVRGANAGVFLQRSITLSLGELPAMDASEESKELGPMVEYSLIAESHKATAPAAGEYLQVARLWWEP